MKTADPLESKSAEAFRLLAEELNFTWAARRAGLTQSALSQRIARLEEEIGAPLFFRINKRISLSEVGRSFLDLVRERESLWQQFEQRRGTEGQPLHGEVRYAMPESCLYTPHYPLLLAKLRAAPALKLKVLVLPNAEVVEALLREDVDFGFVTQEIRRPGVLAREFSRESYALVGSKGQSAWNGDRRSLKDLEFLLHPGFEDLFDLWQRSRWPQARPLTLRQLKISGEASSLQALIPQLREGRGVSVLSRHVVGEDLSSAKLKEMGARGERRDGHPIYLATLADRARTPRVDHVIELFFDLKARELKAASARSV